MVLLNRVLLVNGKLFLQTSDIHLRDILPGEAPITIWNEYYYPALFAAEKTTVNASITSFDAPIPSSAAHIETSVLHSNVGTPITSNPPHTALHPVLDIHIGSNQIPAHESRLSSQNVQNSVFQDADQ